MRYMADIFSELKAISGKEWECVWETQNDTIYDERRFKVRLQ
jgi:ubiquitin-protein ligase